MVTSHETLEKFSILFKVKEGDDFNHRNTRLVFRGLESESDAEIGQKGTFFKRLGTSGSGGVAHILLKGILHHPFYCASSLPEGLKRNLIYIQGIEAFFRAFHPLQPIQQLLSLENNISFAKTCQNAPSFERR